MIFQYVRAIIYIDFFILDFHGMDVWGELMKVSIKQIADAANVSIATVSNALNKTRYVSPALSERIFSIATEMGYFEQNETVYSSGLRVGKQSEIAFIAPNLMSTHFSNMVNELSLACINSGYVLSVYTTNNDPKIERLIISEALANRRIAGICLCPSHLDSMHYKKLLTADKPCICFDREIEEAEIDCVLSDHGQGIRNAMQHLLNNGHERIALLIEDRTLSSTREQREGYVSALSMHGVTIDPDLILNVPLTDGYESREAIKRFIRRHNPSAIIAAGNTLTLRCLKSIEEMGLNCPQNISVIGYGDNEWCSLITPALTALTQNTREIARVGIGLLLNKIKTPQVKAVPQKIRVPMDFTVRESTISIACGPFGERVASPEEIALSSTELDLLREGDYSVAIAFHYTGTAWTRLHERAIKDSLSSWGVRVIAVTDAGFNAQLQNTQLDSLIMQSPDALIAIPVDEHINGAKFKEVSKKTKLVLINNVPNGLAKDDYACWISVNEKENGQAAARVLIDYMHDARKPAKVGMLVHGTPFFCTKQRDYFAERSFLEDKLNTTLVAKRSFYTIENAYDACRQLIQEYPEINCLYITWDQPALQAIKALRDMGRTDVHITTTDLDYDIASYIENGDMVVGLSSQRPYEQGSAVAVATARALLNIPTSNTCIGVPPYTVRSNNLEKAWKDILKTEWKSHRDE